MRAAIYARKSTADERDKDDGKSTERQITSARAFAEKKGWQVIEPPIIDEGVSGLEFIKRPGLNTLKALVASDPRPFDVVIVWKQSRLGRDALRTASVLRDFRDCGVEVYEYSTGQPCLIDGAAAMAGVMAAVKGLPDEQQAIDAGNDARDGLRPKAAQGFVTGHRTLGYDLKRVADHTERVVNKAQAAVIQRIFALSASGEGDRGIVKTLRAERAPAWTWSNTKDKTGRPEGWVERGTWDQKSDRVLVGRILANETYTGRSIFGKTKSIRTSGRAHKQFKVSDRNEWIIVPNEALRIIADDVWTAVRARKAQTKVAYAAVTEKAPKNAKPGTGLVGKYLLTGVARCGDCGSSMTVMGKGKYVYYYCANRSDGGTCKAKGGTHVEILDRLVVRAIWGNLLRDVSRLKKIIADYEVAARAAREVERKAAGPNPTVEIKRLEKENARAVKAVMTGAGSDAMTIAIAKNETRIKELKALRAEPAPVAKAPEADRLLDALAAMLPWEAQGDDEDIYRAGQAWKGWKAVDAAGVRDVLRRLGVDRITVHRSGKDVEIKGLADLSGFLESARSRRPACRGKAGGRWSRPA